MKSDVRMTFDEACARGPANLNVVLYQTRRELVFWRVAHGLRALLCLTGAHDRTLYPDGRCYFCELPRVYFVRPRPA